MKILELFATASPELKAARLRLASLTFLYPDIAWRERLVRFMEGIEGAGALRNALDESLISDLQKEHFRLFGPQAVCPLEISSYLSENPFEQAKVMAQMSGFYRAFGLEFAEGMRPDALPVSLEFFSHLLLKEENAKLKSREAEAVTEKARRDFLREFLRPGISAFQKRLFESTQNSFYRTAADLSLREVSGSFLGFCRN